MVRIDVHITRDPLDIQGVTNSVLDPGAGAVSTFIGTTRNTFHGKRVVELSYEAYEPMALQELRKVGEQCGAKWASLLQVTLHHRLGTVAVQEASVVIAVSSPHRADAIAACAFAIDELKARVPIWKREIYEDGSEW
eukprot:CAMPEP_0185849456 /NCGR_PEP_ID=MMETSP1354-20130828/3958_1 /TAXON_ID=708628 /ORGANISM="Erythrolobus madagascarensis, Strain CCMP3276" /LENGTH=136 /DNA_ID=CAMNT_0028549989 /DNA_START=260 /DNA_END=667 /DNA_ORIENTATION=+